MHCPVCEKRAIYHHRSGQQPHYAPVCLPAPAPSPLSTNLILTAAPLPTLRHVATGQVAFVSGAVAAVGSSVVKVPIAVCIRSVQAGVYPNVVVAAKSIVRAAGPTGLFTVGVQEGQGCGKAERGNLQQCCIWDASSRPAFVSRSVGEVRVQYEDMQGLGMGSPLYLAPGVACRLPWAPAHQLTNAMCPLLSQHHRGSCPR
jgi:hypothetical protein